MTDPREERKIELEFEDDPLEIDDLDDAFEHAFNSNRLSDAGSFRKAMVDADTMAKDASPNPTSSMNWELITEYIPSVKSETP